MSRPYDKGQSSTKSSSPSWLHRQPNEVCVRPKEHTILGICSFRKRSVCTRRKSSMHAQLQTTHIPSRTTFISWFDVILSKFIKNFSHMAAPLTELTSQPRKGRTTKT